MALPKPSKKPEWATGAADIVEPGATKKAVGWLVEKPPHQFWNWFWNLCYQWISYFESKTDELTDELSTELGVREAADTLLTDKITRLYDYIVGDEPGCTHATLEAALAACTGGEKVYVASTVFSDDTYNITLADIEIAFKASAYCNHSMPTGDTIYINAPNVTIRGGIFAIGGGNCISIGPLGKAAMLRDIRFLETGEGGADISDPNDLASVIGCITVTL